MDTNCEKMGKEYLEWLERTVRMAKKDKEKHKYLVGFIGDRQCVYGKDKKDSRFANPVASYTQPMTIRQAVRQLKILTGRKTIYELKPISTTKARVLTKMPKLLIS